MEALKTAVFFAASLRYYYMWCRKQHRQSRDDCKQREYNKAQSVDHHGCVLPVSVDVCSLAVFAKLICDETDLLQNQR